MFKYTTLYPSDILNAINLAKSDSDPHGYSAFRISYNSNPRIAGGATFIPFQVNHEGKWTPVNLNFLKLTSNSKFYTIEEKRALSAKGSKAGNVQGHSLSFSAGAQYTRTTSFTEGRRTVKKEIVEPYWEAKMAIDSAFLYHFAQDYQSGKLNNALVTNNKAVRIIVTQKVGKGGMKENLEPSDYYTRVKVQFLKEKDATALRPDAPLRKGIHITDMNCPLSKEDKARLLKEAKEKNEDIPSTRFAIIKDGDDPINYSNICKYITPGSLVTGNDYMGDICLHAFGVSLGSEVKGELAVAKCNKTCTSVDEAFEDDDLLLKDDEKASQEGEKEADEGEEISDLPAEIALENSAFAN